MLRTAPLSLTPTPRDIAILEMVWSYGGITQEHISRRFFPTPGARAACYARLSKLVDATFLTDTRLPSSSGKGSGPMLLTLGIAGRRFLSETLSLSPSALGRQSRARAPLFLQHHLAIAEVRLAFEMATYQSSVFSDIEWVAEWELRRKPLRVNDPISETTTVLIPDGALELVVSNELSQRFLVEVDMGTVTNPQRFRSKLRGYLLRNAKHDEPVLWIVPDEHRAKTLVDCAINEATKLFADATVFLVAERRAINHQSVLDGPIWSIIGGPSTAGHKSCLS